MAGTIPKSDPKSDPNGGKPEVPTVAVSPAPGVTASPSTQGTEPNPTDTVGGKDSKGDAVTPGVHQGTQHVYALTNTYRDQAIRDLIKNQKEHGVLNIFFEFSFKGIRKIYKNPNFPISFTTTLSLNGACSFSLTLFDNTGYDILPYFAALSDRDSMLDDSPAAPGANGAPTGAASSDKDPKSSADGRGNLGYYLDFGYVWGDFDTDVPDDEYNNSKFKLSFGKMYFMVQAVDAVFENNAFQITLQGQIFNLAVSQDKKTATVITTNDGQLAERDRRLRPPMLTDITGLSSISQNSGEPLQIIKNYCSTHNLYFDENEVKFVALEGVSHNHNTTDITPTRYTKMDSRETDLNFLKRVVATLRDAKTGATLVVAITFDKKGIPDSLKPNYSGELHLRQTAYITDVGGTYVVQDAETTVVRWAPSMTGIKAVAGSATQTMVGQEVTLTDTGVNDQSKKLDTNTNQVRKQIGVNANITRSSSSTMDSLNAKVEASNKSLLLYTQSMQAELTVLGDPTLRLSDTLHQFYIDFKYPFTYRDSDTDMSLVPHFTSGYYRIQTITHSMSAGQFLTTLSLLRMARAGDPGFRVPPESPENKNTGKKASVDKPIKNTTSNPVVPMAVAIYNSTGA
jgi:hypothetical protein